MGCQESFHRQGKLCGKLHLKSQPHTVAKGEMLRYHNLREAGDDTETTKWSL